MQKTSSSSAIQETMSNLIRDIAARGNLETGRLVAVETIRRLNVARSDIDAALRRVLETKSLTELLQTLANLKFTLPASERGS